MRPIELARPDWRRFFELLAPALRSHVVQVEAGGLGFEHAVADWVRLARLAYDVGADAIEVVVHGAERTIAHPARVRFAQGEEGLHSIEIFDAAGESVLVLLKEPLELPPQEADEAQTLHERHRRAEVLRHGGLPEQR